MLFRNVRSFGKLADHVIAVDGRYKHFPAPYDTSPCDQQDAIRAACEDGHMGLTVHDPSGAWEGGEVEKRAAMFELALTKATAHRDWFLIVDADVGLGECHGEQARMVLAEANADAADVTCEGIRPDGKVMHTVTHRGMFRALPGLTCKWMHMLYVTESPTRFLWHTPACRISDEPTANLTQLVTIQHRNLDRGADRAWASRMYYRKRDELQLERAPRW